MRRAEVRWLRSNIIGLLALFIALGGGAYATSSSHTTIIVRGPQGKQGKPGKPGPAGPEGPANTCELEHHAQVGCVAPAQGPKGDTGQTGEPGRPGLTPVAPSVNDFILLEHHVHELESGAALCAASVASRAHELELSTAPGDAGEDEHREATTLRTIRC
jgi:hypothetical protein